MFCEISLFFLYCRKRILSYFGNMIYLSIFFYFYNERDQLSCYQSDFFSEIREKKHNSVAVYTRLSRLMTRYRNEHSHPENSYKFSTLCFSTL